MVRSGGRPPWERGAAGVGGDAEAGGSDVGGENRVLANGALGEFIDMCIPVGGRRVFTRLGVALWTIMWFVLFLAQVGLQARYAFFERDSARGGVWFLQMAGISLSSDWWPVAVFFDVGVVPGLLLWLAAHVMRKPWIAVAGDVLIVQCVATQGHTATGENKRCLIIQSSCTDMHISAAGYPGSMAGGTDCHRIRISRTDTVFIRYRGTLTPVHGQIFHTIMPDNTPPPVIFRNR